MKILVKSIAAAAIAAGGAMTAAAPALAETLVLSSWLPPRHPVVVGAIRPWAEQVEEATQGRVTVRVLAKPLGPPPAHFDMARDGVADITYGLHSFTRDDRFLRSRIGQFSFLAETAADGSVAFWDVYAGDLDAQAEHEGVKLLGVFVHGPGMFLNNQRAITEVDAFQGLKIRTPGGYIAELVGELGATTQFMGPSEVYEKLTRGIIDGVTFPTEAINAFKLQDDLGHVLRAPGGLYNTSWFLVMNSAKWDAISEADQAAIERVSGEAFARLVGGVWDEVDAKGWETIEAVGMTVTDAEGPVLDRISAIAAAKEAEWVAALSAQGFDGAAALTRFRARAGVTN